VAVEAAGASALHLDVMDGHFVPNISIGIPIVQAVRRVTDLPLDVHLMISNPAQYVEAFRKAGADSASRSTSRRRRILAQFWQDRSLGRR